MKRIISIFAIFALFLVTSCQEKAGRAFPFAGEWHYTATENGVAEDVWVSFLADGTFEMFQQIGEGPYWYSYGEFTYNAEEEVLSGIYSDRYRWKYDYSVSVSGKTLVMTALGVENYSVTYTKESIPSEVREKSLPLTKSESVERYL